MALDRFVISDSVWSRLSLYLPGKASDRCDSVRQSTVFGGRALAGANRIALA